MPLNQTFLPYASTCPMPTPKPDISPETTHKIPLNQIFADYVDLFGIWQNVQLRGPFGRVDGWRVLKFYWRMDDGEY
eukprot:667743-Amphidinium_carterae.1